MHGSDRGSVDDEHNSWGWSFVDANPVRQIFEKQQMKSPVFSMGHEIRELVVNTAIEVCDNRKWELFAIHARSNHVHLVVNSQEKVERVMSSIKAWLTRRLRVDFPDLDNRKLWTHHGSTRYLWNENDLQKAIEYTIKGQGKPMSFYYKDESGS